MAGEIENPDVLVIGAGLSGLGAALELERRGRRVRVVDANRLPGGVIETQAVKRYRVERGANTFRIHAALQASLRDFDLAEIPEPALPESRSRFVYHEGQLQAVPMGPFELARSRLLSAGAKRQLLKEPFVPRGDAAGESVAEFVDRRLGSETRKALVGPFLTGVYAGDETRLGAEAVFPALVESERRSGSIVRGRVSNWLRSRRQAGPRSRSGSWSGPAGMSGLVDALVARLATAPLQESRVLELHREDSGWLAALRGPKGEERVRAPAVIVATPAHAAEGLLRPVDEEIGSLLAPIAYAPIASLAFGLDPAHSGTPIEGFGFLVPREANLGLLGCLFMSRLFKGRAPEGKELLQVMAGGVRWPEAVDLPDDLLRKRLLGELDRVLGLRAEPELISVARWPRAVPQPGVDHVGRVKAIRRRLAAHPGLGLAGGYLDGVSVADALVSGVAAARMLSARLETQPGSALGQGASPSTSPPT